MPRKKERRREGGYPSPRERGRKNSGWRDSPWRFFFCKIRGGEEEEEEEVMNGIFWKKICLRIAMLYCLTSWTLPLWDKFKDSPPQSKKNAIIAITEVENVHICIPQIPPRPLSDESCHKIREKLYQSISFFISTGQGKKKVWKESSFSIFPSTFIVGEEDGDEKWPPKKRGERGISKGKLYSLLFPGLPGHRELQP